MEHTQEPIYLKEYIPFTYIMDKNHKRLLKVESKDDDLLKRIVSCVNALAGIDDPEAFMEKVRDMKCQYAYTDCKYINMPTDQWCAPCTAKLTKD